MLKTKIVMNEVIISSNHTPEDFAKLVKFAPEALSVVDEKGNEVFSYTYFPGLKEDHPVSKFGILFNAIDNSGKAATVVKLPLSLEGEDAKKEWIAESLGVALQYGAQLEEGFDTKLEEINAAINTIIDGIEVIVQLVNGGMLTAFFVNIF